MKQLPLCPNRRETAWGIRYLLFELLVLPTALSYINLFLGDALNESWLNFLFYCLNLTAALMIFHRFLLVSFRNAVGRLGSVLGNAAAFLIVYLVLSSCLGILIYRFFPDFVNINDSTIAAMATDSFPVWLLATVVLVPPAEELLFRGALFGGFFQRSRIAAYVLSVVGFCLLHVFGYVGHYSWDILLLCALQYIPAGLCLAWAYRASGSIFSPMIMHSIINAIGIFAMR